MGQHTLSDRVEIRPIVFVSLLAVGILALQHLWYFVFPNNSDLERRFLGKAVISIAAMTLITRLGWWSEMRIANPFRWGIIRVALPLLLLPLLSWMISDIGDLDMSRVLVAVLFSLLVGFSEEIIARGMFLKILEPYGVRRAVLLSSGLFGIMHFGNILMGGSWSSVLAQVIYATLIGIAFSGVVITTGSLWPVIFTHALTDFFPALTVDNDPGARMDLLSAVIAISVQVPFAIYGLWLLHRSLRLRSSRTSRAATLG